MSDSNETGAATSTSAFTDRELQMLGWAMQSLKTGPPEVPSSPDIPSSSPSNTPQIDYEKLAGFAGMSNPRSASNAWAKIKGKLLVNPDGTVASPAPKKAAGGRKKSSPADSEAATPKKVATPRKRAAKKQEVEGEEASPKKKGRGAKKTEKSEESE